MSQIQALKTCSPFQLLGSFVALMNSETRFVDPTAAMPSSISILPRLPNPRTSAQAQQVLRYIIRFDLLQNQHYTCLRKGIAFFAYLHLSSGVTVVKLVLNHEPRHHLFNLDQILWTAPIWHLFRKHQL